VVALAIEKVAVWLDALAPQGGAFAHALEWAARLRLPLQSFAPADLLAGALAGERLRSCEAACGRHGIPWGVYLWREPDEAATERFFRGVQLCVFGAARPGTVPQDLLSRSLYNAGVPVLVCPELWQPLSRVLVVQQHPGAGSGFLHAAAEVCRAFAIRPVVLTVARSERDAQRRQHLAEDRLAAQRLAADFDYLVGCDLATAVTRVAQWRRCSHVFLERPDAAGWWHRLWGDPLRQLHGLAGSLTLLALPERAVPPGDGLPANPAPTLDGTGARLVSAAAPILEGGK
jgi:hypothetical protein